MGRPPLASGPEPLTKLVACPVEYNGLDGRERVVLALCSSPSLGPVESPKEGTDNVLELCTAEFACGTVKLDVEPVAEEPPAGA